MDDRFKKIEVQLQIRKKFYPFLLEISNEFSNQELVDFLISFNANFVESIKELLKENKNG